MDSLRHGKLVENIDELLNITTEQTKMPKSDDVDEVTLIDFKGIDLNVTKSELDNEENCGERFLTQQGKLVSIKLVQKLLELIDRAVQTAIENCKETKKEEKEWNCECSIKGYLYKAYLDLVKKEFGVSLDPESSDEVLIESLGIKKTMCDLVELVNGVYLWRWKWENIENGRINLFDLNAKHYGALSKPARGLSRASRAESIKGKNEYSYKDIMDALVENNKQKFNERLRLSHSVKKIMLCELLDGGESSEAKSQQDCPHCQLTDEHDKVLLVLEDNSNSRTESSEVNNELYVICDNVICTMSLGFLKENFDSLFVPLRFMGKAKRESVNRLGYATFNKIFLKYDKPFWDENFRGLHLLWLPENKSEMLEHLSHVEHTGDIKCDWSEDVTSFKVAKSQENVLYASLPNNECFEKIDDKRIASECTRLLKQFMGREDIPEPVSIYK